MMALLTSQMAWPGTSSSNLGFFLKKIFKLKTKPDKYIPGPAILSSRVDLLVESDRGFQHEHVTMSLGPGLVLLVRQERRISPDRVVVHFLPIPATLSARPLQECGRTDLILFTATRKTNTDKLLTIKAGLDFNVELRSTKLKLRRPGNDNREL